MLDANGTKIDNKVVNHPTNKIDSKGLAKGRPMFVDDIKIEGMIHGKILGSPHAHAKITSIDTSAAEKLPGVHAVLCYKNVPRVPHTTAGQGFPEPSPYDTYSFDSKMRFVGDRVAAVAADTIEIAEEACKLIKVEYEVLEPILHPKDALKKDAPIIHDEKDCKVIIPIPYYPEKNIASEVMADVGDVEKGFKDADHVIEHEYETHYAQHCPIEPHICIAYFDEYDRIVLRTSTQVPFHARRIAAQCLQIPVSKIRVIKPRIGGGFGTKQEVLLEDVTAMLAVRSKRPVRLALTRSEELMSSRTRHPMVVKIKTGVKNDGHITAVDLQVLCNTGAYGSHGLTVPCNSGSKVLPLYRADHMYFKATTVYTNMPVGGAYRGYGATQACYGMEMQMDEMAEKIGMDPIKFREMNHIKEGEGSPIFEKLGEGTEGVPMKIGSCGLTDAINKGKAAIKWDEKWAKYKKLNADNTRKDAHIKHGLGMCLLMQGSSIPKIDMGSVTLKMNEDGSFNMTLGATDLGTGSDTVLAQIAAETLGVSLDKIIVYSSDTDLTPFDVGAYASSTTYLTGMAAHKAALKIKEQIIEVASQMMKEEISALKFDGPAVVSTKTNKKLTYGEICIRALYNHDQFQIIANASHITEKSPPPFSAQFVDLTVDTETGKIKVEEFVAAVDCGTAINPQLAEGQIEGGVLNALSFALTERYIFDKNGKMLNDNFRYYRIFTTQDYPKITPILIPTYEDTGPYGAKSVSEIGINGALPSIGNAIYNATGVRMRSSPFTPERVYAALKEENKLYK